MWSSFEAPLCSAYRDSSSVGSTPGVLARRCICILPNPEKVLIWSMFNDSVPLFVLIQDRSPSKGLEPTDSDLSIHICSLGLSITCPRSFTPLSPIVAFLCLSFFARQWLVIGLDSVGVDFRLVGLSALWVAGWAVCLTAGPTFDRFKRFLQFSS